MTKKLPSDVAYENGMTCGSGNTQAHPDQDISRNEDVIDWDQSMDISPDVRTVTTTAATQFHYANTAHLMLCGEILKHEFERVTADTQWLASTLSTYKVCHADIWGKYIRKTGGGASISAPMKQYFQLLFSEDDILAALTGMQLFGGPVASTIYNTLSDHGDAMFMSLCDHTGDDKEAETQITVERLAPLIADVSPERRAYLSKQSATYKNAINDILQAHEKDVKLIGVDPEALATDIEKSAKKYLGSLGLLP